MTKTQAVLMEVMTRSHVLGLGDLRDRPSQRVGIDRLRHVDVVAGGNRKLAVTRARVRSDGNRGKTAGVALAFTRTELPNQGVTVFLRHAEIGEQHIGSPSVEGV